MLDDSHFYAITNATMLHIHDQLEEAFDRGDVEDLDMDEGSGVLTIVTSNEATFIINRHSPTRQLWLASPISGGLHFGYNQEKQEWALPDGRLLKSVLAEDLKKKAGIRVVL